VLSVSVALLLSGDYYLSISGLYFVCFHLERVVTDECDADYDV
jgi:hypothetical protein